MRFVPTQVGSFPRYPINPEFGRAWQLDEELRIACAKASTHNANQGHSSFKSLTGVVLACLVGTGGLPTPEFVAERNDRGYRFEGIDFRATPYIKSEAPQLRLPTVADSLARVRDVFKISVTELASLFGVSRQTIYNWQGGQAIAEQSGTRLHELTEAADQLEALGFTQHPSTLRRKLPDGKTVVESVCADMPASKAVAALQELVRREMQQRKALDSRLAGRRQGSPVSLADAGIPFLNEES